jgi:hypothetical protein
MQIRVTAQADGFVLADLRRLVQAKHGRHFAVAVVENRLGNEKPRHQAVIWFGREGDFAAKETATILLVHHLRVEWHSLLVAWQIAHDLLHGSKDVLATLLPIRWRPNGMQVASLVGIDKQVESVRF